jgi:hypothetical protein
MDTIGKVKIADDNDFERLKKLCQCHDGWRLDYCRHDTTVWTRSNDVSDFRMVKIRGVYEDITAEVLYDVLHDPVYRKMWDPNIVEGKELCRINDYSDIGYYSMQLPRPLTGRDFVTQRSWRDLGVHKLILNHSVNHAAMPPQRDFIRGISYLTGYHIISTVNNPQKPGCEVTYVTQSDPKGSLPVWVVNKSTQWLAPKVITKLRKACLSYNEWKKDNSPGYKPWIYPEQNTLPLLNPADILTLSTSTSQAGFEGNYDESQVAEEHMSGDDRLDRVNA